MAEQDNQLLEEVPDVSSESVPENSFSSLVFTAVILAVGCVFLAQSMTIGSQAAVWPRMLSIALVACAALRLILQASRYLAGRGTVGIDGPAGEARPGGLRALWSGEATWRRLFTTVWLVAYCIIARYAGFGPTALVFIPVYMWVCGFRKPLWIILITLAALASYTVLFDTLVSVPVWSNRL